MLNQLFQRQPIRRRRAFPREQHRPRQFSLRQIRAERFTGTDFRAEQIHAVVVNLIRRAHRRAEFLQRRALRGLRAAQKRRQIAREREQLARLHADDAEIIFLRRRKIPPLLRLQNFTGTHRVRRQRHRAANFRRRIARRQLQRLRKQAVAEQHRDFIAPFRRHRWAAAPDFRLIHHVVVDERGEVNHLDDDRRRDVGFIGFAEATGGQRHQRRAQMFAAVVQRVLGVRHDLRIKLPRLPDELGRHGMQKRLHRFHDFFPGTGGVGSKFGMGVAHVGFSSQHRGDFTFAAPVSQTCYVLVKQMESVNG